MLAVYVDQSRTRTYILENLAAQFYGKTFKFYRKPTNNCCEFGQNVARHPLKSRASQKLRPEFDPTPKTSFGYEFFGLILSCLSLFYKELLLGIGSSHIDRKSVV